MEIKNQDDNDIENDKKINKNSNSYLKKVYKHISMNKLNYENTTKQNSLKESYKKKISKFNTSISIEESQKFNMNIRKSKTSKIDNFSKLNLKSKTKTDVELIRRKNTNFIKKNSDINLSPLSINNKKTSKA